MKISTTKFLIFCSVILTLFSSCNLRFFTGANYWDKKIVQREMVDYGEEEGEVKVVETENRKEFTVDKSGITSAISSQKSAESEHFAIDRLKDLGKPKMKFLDLRPSLQNYDIRQSTPKTKSLKKYQITLGEVLEIVAYLLAIALILGGLIYLYFFVVANPLFLLKLVILSAPIIFALYCIYAAQAKDDVLWRPIFILCGIIAAFVLTALGASFFAFTWPLFLWSFFGILVSAFCFLILMVAGTISG